MKFVFYSLAFFVGICLFASIFAMVHLFVVRFFKLSDVAGVGTIIAASILFVGGMLKDFEIKKHEEKK
jgi:hypothetical protein